MKRALRPSEDRRRSATRASERHSLSGDAELAGWASERHSLSGDAELAGWATHQKVAELVDEVARTPGLLHEPVHAGSPNPFDRVARQVAAREHHADVGLDVAQRPQCGRAVD